MTQLLRILQVSTADVAGGAERVALDLHRAYLAQGHDATLAVGWKFADYPHVVRIPNDERRNAWTGRWNSLASHIAPEGQSMSAAQLIARRLCKTAGSPARALRVAAGYDDFDFPGTRWIIEQAPNYDVVHLHNLHGGYFDLRLLPELCAVAPVVITAHDLWLATGHCAHGVDCERWKTGCGQCPYLGFPPGVRKDKTHENWLAKQDIFQRCQVSGGALLAAPAQWALNILGQSMAAPAFSSAHRIANGVDTSVFHPRDKAAARKELGLPHEVPILTFSAADPNNPFKDAKTLFEALPEIARDHPELYLVVLGDASSLPVVPGTSVYAPGFLSEPFDVARHLCASDLYIHAARAEVLPLAILEAQACGLPVVATDVGGVSEALIDEETGVLVPIGDPRALAQAVRDMLADPECRERWGSQATLHAADAFSMNRMVSGYLDLYRS